MKRDIPYFVVALGVAFVCVAALLSKYFFAAPVIPILMIALFALYKMPEYGLLVLVFFVPLEGLFAGNSLFTGPKIIGIALIAIVSVKLLRKEVPITNLRTPLWWPIFFLIFAFGLGALLSPHPSVSMQSFKQLLTAISVFYIALAIKSEVKPLHLIRVIVISVAMTAFFALVGSERTEGGRAVGLLTDPNYFALLLTFATPFAIYLLIHEKPFFFRVFGFVSLAIILVAFEKTLSRSGLVVLVLVIAVLGIHYKAYLRKLNATQISLIFGAAGLLGLTLISLAPQEYRERIASLANVSSGVHTFEDRSLGRRSSYIIVAFDEFKKNPIFGAGPGIFPLRYAQSGYAVAFSLNKNEPELFRRAHNTYLETVAETGALGLFSLCGVIWLGLRQIWLARRVHLRRGDFQQAAFAAHYFAAFFAIVLFFLFLTGINNKYFWICLALSGSFSHSIAPSTLKIEG